MMKVGYLPPQYKAFEKINFCSNLLINVELLFTINGNIPLLVGAGDFPRVWLSIPADVKGENWQTLIRDNQTLHPEVTVRTENSTTIIETPHCTVLKVVKESAGIAKIHFLDLTPFGINIKGDASSLMVMNNTLSGNTFSNVNTMIEMGRDRENLEAN